MPTRTRRSVATRVPVHVELRHQRVEKSSPKAPCRAMNAFDATIRASSWRSRSCARLRSVSTKLCSKASTVSERLGVSARAWRTSSASRLRLTGRFPPLRDGREVSALLACARYAHNTGNTTRAEGWTGDVSVPSPPAQSTADMGGDDSGCEPSGAPERRSACRNPPCSQDEGRWRRTTSAYGAKPKGPGGRCR